MSIPEPVNSDEIRFLRLPEVRCVTGLSKSSLYELIRAHSFPAPIHLGPRTVAWVKSEVTTWATERIRASRLAEPLPGGRRMPQRSGRSAWQASKRCA